MSTYFHLQQSQQRAFISGGLGIDRGQQKLVLVAAAEIEVALVDIFPNLMDRTYEESNALQL